MPKVTFSDLSAASQAVLGQLFLRGPTWDGNIIAKSGRNELVLLGFCIHQNGWAYLTSEGVELALAADVSHWHDKHWYRKQQNID
jgi:hypothetical protein